MTNQPIVDYPDFHRDFTKGSVPDYGWGVIQELFGRSAYFEPDIYANKPIDAHTLALAYAGRPNEHITDILHQNFVNGDGWQFAFAPLRRTQGMGQEWRVFTMDRHSMDAAPEETAPRYTSSRSERHEEKLTRYSIGARAYGDFYNRPEGKTEMLMNFNNMISGGWITCKLIVSQAIFNAKLEYQEQDAKTGVEYRKVAEAMQDEVELFAALSKDQKAIYKLQDYVEQKTASASPRFNMAVFNKGALSYIAFASAYETEANRRGTEVVQRRLTMGAKSMIGILPGITIYEDEYLNLANLPTDDITHFVRTVDIGEFTMIDGKNHGEGKSNYHSGNELSIMQASMDVGGWKKFSIYDAIRNSMRWTPDGNLTPNLHEFVQHIGYVLKKTGIALDNPNHVDPYVWRSDREGLGNNDRYTVIEHWGDMDVHYNTVRQNILFGEAVAKLVRKEMSDDEFKNLRELKELIDRLYDVHDITSEAIQGYFFAIVANPENKPTRDSDIMLRANRHGSVQLPHVDRTPNIELSKKYVGTTGATALPNGALYVTNPTTRTRLYVWAVEPVVGEILNETTGTYRLTLDQSDKTLTETQRAKIASFDPKKREYIVSGFKPLGPQGAPIAYLLAPISQFEDLTESGEAIGYKFVNQSLIGRLLDRDTPGGATVSSELIGGGNTLGIRTIRLVSAPGTPVGYGYINGARTIAQLAADMDYRGWDEVMCKQALSGITAADKLAKILTRISPECALLDETYTPEFMRTNVPSVNKANNILSNLFDHVKYPVWARAATRKTSYGLDTMIGYISEPEQTEEVGLLTIEHVNTIAAAIMNPPSQSVKDILKAVLGNSNVDQKIYSALMKDPASLIKAYEKTNIGAAYGELHTSAAKHPERFVHILEREIGGLIKQERVIAAVNVFNTILGIAYQFMTGQEKSSHQTPDTVKDLILRAMKLGETKTSTYKTPLYEEHSAHKTVRDRTISGGSKYYNTRLCVSDVAFHSISAEASYATVGELEFYSKQLLRPSNPLDPFRPLGDIDVTSAKDRRDDLETFQHARAGHDRSRIADLIFGNTSLIQDHSRAERIIHRPKSLRQPDDDVEMFDPYKETGSHMPRSLLDDAIGPLYTRPVKRPNEDLVDRKGKPLEQTEALVAKKFLIKRYNEISEVTDDIVRMAALMLILTRVTRQSLENWVDNGLPIPDCCYVIARPFIRLRMSSGLWAEGGSGTANVGYNYDDVVMQFNGMHKTWFLHYTIWLGCAIYDPKKFIIVKDIKFEGYVGGYDDSIISDPSELDTRNIDWKTVKSNLVFSLGANWGREDALRTSNPMPLTGKYDQRALPYKFSDKKRIFNPGEPLWPSFFFYEFIWGFSDINNGVDIDYSTYSSIRDTQYFPGLMFMASHKVYNDRDGDWTTVIEGTGHLKKFDPKELRQALSGKIPINNNMHKDR